MNGLSVIIPSKTATNLSACIKGICGEWERYRPGPLVDGRVEAIRIPPAPEVIVIDDDPGGSVKKVAEYYEARRVEGVKPFVYARNCNLGIVEAGTDDVILLNDDALLQTPGGFTAMQRAAAEHPEYGIIAAVTNIVGNQNQMPQGVGLREDPRMVCFVCVFIPRRTIDRVGLLDEEFVGYGFDDDSYCLRVRRAGLKIGIYDGCFVDHGSLRSTFRGDPRTPANLEHNAAIFRSKYGADNWAL
jgi:GT2 family glycosyltransferase